MNAINQPNFPMNDTPAGELIVQLHDVIPDPNGAQYSIVGALGQGQFGRVYQVVDITSQSPTPAVYAMKITKSHYKYRQQAQHEVHVLSHIQTNATKDELAYISQLVACFEYRGHVCLIIELLSLNIFEVIKRREYRGLDLSIIQTVMKEMLQSLVVLERCQIIHSDIKPENILLADGFSKNVKLIDFGSARFTTQPCAFYVQSRYYRAPEVLLGIPYSTSIDMWSLACVAAEIFLGIPLFPGQSEAHLLVLIVEMLGQFPPNIIQMSSHQNYFENGILKNEEQLCQIMNSKVADLQRYFSYDALDEIIMYYERGLGRTAKAMRIEQEKRSKFIDLLKRMLELDPALRITPSAALQHPFFQIDFGP